MPDVVAEIRRFELWAANRSSDLHPDYWVYEYDDWDALHAAVLELVDAIVEYFLKPS